MSNKKPEDEFMWLLEAIEKYNMDEMEANACRLAVMWLDQSRKTFPDYRHSKMRKGDPRKSLIFKICYKLARESNGIIEKNEYSLYIRAQLDVLKYVNEGKLTPLIDPNCLVGEKAWRRWNLWKKRYDSFKNKPKDAVVTGIGYQKALEGIEKTKEFLVKTFGINLTFDKFKESYINNNIFRWINLGKISPYYLAMSPFIKKLFSQDDFKKINFDPGVYLTCINNQVENKFNTLFPDESATTP